MYLQRIRRNKLEDLYVEAQQRAKQLLYQLMKNQEIPLLNYTFRFFFDYYVDENKILVLPHHFSNRKIEGLTVIDELGVSISYERKNPVTKQNFTLCHELGHFLLEHEGGYFAESVDNQDSQIEREANIFSAVVLMPDIVLLSKIYYSCDSFQKVQDNLEVSKQALCFRLLNLLRDYSPLGEDKLKQAIDDYRQGENATIILLFHDIKEQIICEYNQYKPCLRNQLENCINDKGFASSIDLPDLHKQEDWEVLKQSIKNLKIWLIYNKGNSVAYAWDCTKLSEQEARKKAELQLLLM